MNLQENPPAICGWAFLFYYIDLLADIFEVCRQRQAVCVRSALTTLRYLGNVFDCGARTTCVALSNINSPFTINSAIIQSRFCRCTPCNFAFVIRRNFPDQSCFFCFIRRREVISICKHRSTRALIVRSLFTRSNIANNLPATSSTGFCSICILQLHVVCGRTIRLMDYGKFVSLL